MPKGYGLSEATKDGIWELRAQGLSEREIGRRLGLPRATVSSHLARIGRHPAQGPPAPREVPDASNEREEISRGFAAGAPGRLIARVLGRAPSTISREIARNGGRARYRAGRAERRAWDLAPAPEGLNKLERRTVPCAKLVAAKLSRGLIAAADRGVVEGAAPGG